jgi:cationic amino acid transporter 1
LFFGGPDSLPWILARHQLPWFGIIVDPCAAALVLVVTVLLCVGIKEVTVCLFISFFSNIEHG